jgi:hypothetical protein
MSAFKITTNPSIVNKKRKEGIFRGILILRVGGITAFISSGKS